MTDILELLGVNRFEWEAIIENNSDYDEEDC